MGLTYPTVTPGNMELTPCQVKFNGVDLGGTLKNVKVMIEHKKAEIKADQFGETVIDRRISGHMYKIETVLAEPKSKANWKVAFPNMLKITAGNGAGYFDMKVGQADLDSAAILLLHPLSIDPGVLDHDHKFYKAVAESISEVVFGPTEQMGLKIVWNVYPDTSVSPARFYFHGDPANGLVAASAGAASFSGTGNGTCTAIGIHSGVTKTETITLKCVGIPSAHKSNWYISGSVSGAIGELELTGGAGGTGVFTSSVVDFTITDGSTDFIVGDTFTIATVAANYA